jgi:hypothetical protein
MYRVKQIEDLANRIQNLRLERIMYGVQLGTHRLNEIDAEVSYLTSEKQKLQGCYLVRYEGVLVYNGKSQNETIEVCMYCTALFDIDTDVSGWPTEWDGQFMNLVREISNQIPFTEPSIWRIKRVA